MNTILAQVAQTPIGEYSMAGLLILGVLHTVFRFVGNINGKKLKEPIRVQCPEDVTQNLRAVKDWCYAAQIAGQLRPAEAFATGMKPLTIIIEKQTLVLERIEKSIDRLTDAGLVNT